jgi:hypothetical protein
MLARCVEGDLKVSIGGVEAAAEHGFIDDFRHRVPRLAGRVCGTDNMSIESGVLYKNAELAIQFWSTTNDATQSVASLTGAIMPAVSMPSKVCFTSAWSANAIGQQHITPQKYTHGP